MYTDLHCHILPDVDDGPSDLAGSIEIAKVLVSLGFGTVVATPHALPQFAGAEVVAERVTELFRALVLQKVPLQVVAGAENRLTAEFLQAEYSGAGRHLGKTPYVLVETPYETVVPAFGDLLFRLRSKGVRPVIAHPERCAQFDSLERAQEAVRMGAVLQLDLGSLVGQYGKPARKSAERLLDAGLFGVAATDLHGAEGSLQMLEKSLRQLKKVGGEENCRLLLDVHPALILRGEEII